MNIEEKIERDKKKYAHLRDYKVRPRAKISSAYHTYLTSAKHFGYKLDFTLKDFTYHLYSLGYSELYARWRDSGVQPKRQPKILQRRRTERITLDSIFITTLYEIWQDYQKGLKRCTACDTKKSLDSFTKNKTGLFKLESRCKECALEYNRTVEGLVRDIYGGQRSSSRHRKHPMPSYSKKELISWLYENGLEALYKAWVASGYKKSLRPSTDRLDSLKPYTFDNMELVTWEENKRRGYEDVTNGVGAGGKRCRPVTQYTLEGGFVAEYPSVHAAARAIGINRANISAVANGRAKAAGEFLWKDAKDY